jgi:transcriptional regulator with XRE-family HTH domain
MTHHLPCIPNQRLKQACLARGWSQRLFVQQIDQQAVRMGYASALPDRRTIRRWESGQSRPSPFYQTILCALLDKEPEALGMLPASPVTPVPVASEEVNTTGQMHVSEGSCFLPSQEGHQLQSALSTGKVSLVPCYLVIFLPASEETLP